MGTYNKLYKGRYLIALYDKNDVLVAVGDNPYQLGIRRPQSFYEQMCRKDMSFHKCKVHLIDCLEIHDDIFKEEDEIFIDEFYDGYTSIEERVVAKAKELGISRRTAYRWKAQGKLKGF